MSARQLRSSCYQKAVDLLGRRAHFRRQLAEKLARRGYSDEEIQVALDRLSEQRYLDDEQVARQFVSQRLARGGMGRRRLRVELKRRGAPEEVVEHVLEELVPADDLEMARQTAQRWLARGRPDTAALARHLERKGFSRRAIVTILKGLGARGPGDHEE